MRNKKGNVLVVFLGAALIVCAGVAGYFYRSLKNQKPATPSAVNTVNWSKYSDGVYEISYPPEVEISEAQSTDYGTSVLTLHLKESQKVETFAPYLTFQRNSTIVSADEWVSSKSYLNVREQQGCSFGNNDFVCFQSDSGPSSYEIHRVGKLRPGLLIDAYEWWPGSGVGGSNEKLLAIFDQILSTLKFLDREETNATENWVTYTDAGYKFSIRRPANWKIAQEGDGVSFIDPLLPFPSPSVASISVVKNWSLEDDKKQSVLKMNGVILNQGVFDVEDVQLVGISGKKYKISNQEGGTNQYIFLPVGTVTYKIVYGLDGLDSEVFLKLIKTFKID